MQACASCGKGTTLRPHPPVPARTGSREVRAPVALTIELSEQKPTQSRSPRRQHKNKEKASCSTFFWRPVSSYRCHGCCRHVVDFGPQTQSKETIGSYPSTTAAPHSVSGCDGWLLTDMYPRNIFCSVLSGFIEYGERRPEDDNPGSCGRRYVRKLPSACVRPLSGNLKVLVTAAPSRAPCTVRLDERQRRGMDFTRSSAMARAIQQSAQVREYLIGVIDGILSIRYDRERSLHSLEFSSANPLYCRRVEQGLQDLPSKLSPKIRSWTFQGPPTRTSSGSWIIM